MHNHYKILLALSTMMLSGCHFGPSLKRQSELSCPTDIRQTIPWCAGEDAIFHCPCRPSYEFYGHKPTCWGTWPTSGPEWRDAYCGYNYRTTEEFINLPDPVGEPIFADPEIGAADPEIVQPGRNNQPIPEPAIQIESQQGRLEQTPSSHVEVHPKGRSPVQTSTLDFEQTEQVSTSRQQRSQIFSAPPQPHESWKGEFIR